MTNMQFFSFFLFVFIIILYAINQYRKTQPVLQFSYQLVFVGI